MVDRVSTSQLHNNSLRNLGLVQADMANISRQTSSGFKASTYQDLNGIVERVSGYQTKMTSIENYNTNNAGAATKLGTMDSTLTTIENAASSFNSLLTLNKNTATGSPANFVKQAQSILDQITGSLNTSVGGAYIFGGSKTDTPPIKTPIPSLVEDGKPDNGYYNGDSNTPDIRISDTQKINTKVTAGDPGFQNLIASIKTAIAAFQNTASPSATLLSKATDLFNASLPQISALHAQVGADQSSIDAAKADNDAVYSYLQKSLSDDEDTDIAEASTKLANDNVLLQASYQAFASISKLNLTSYLN